MSKVQIKSMLATNPKLAKEFRKKTMGMMDMSGKKNPVMPKK